MRFNEETGEILEVGTSPYKHDTKPYADPYDKSKVMCKRDVEDYFKEEFGNPTIKVRWTNWAMDELFNIDPQTAYKFKLLAELIIARNIVFETTENLAKSLNVKKSYIHILLKTFSDNGLVKEYKGHQGGRSWRYLELNPTLVFKTYQAKSEEFHYGSTSRFNSIHQFYIDKWLSSYIL